MIHPTTAPYGTWKSPITADLIVAESIGLGQVMRDGADIYWAEMRPQEKGRYVVVRRTPDGKTTDVNPAPFNARTRVHEYGGGSYSAHKGTLYFTNFADQRLYRQSPGGTPEALTPEGLDIRFADCVMDSRRNRLIGVREDHRAADREAVNTIAALDLATGGEGQVLVSGYDFYASPRLSPDGSQLVWQSWNHPNMPWDGCELWLADVQADGLLGAPRLVAGGLEESIFQPQWSPDGTLYFVSDRSGWWNLYRLVGNAVEAVAQREAEFGAAQWVFGQSIYGFAGPDRIICSYTAEGLWHLAAINTKTLAFTPLESPYTVIHSLRVSQTDAVFEGGSPTLESEIVRLELATGQFSTLRRSGGEAPDSRYISPAQPIAFPTENGLTAHGFYYPPHNADFTAPAGDRPPLLVISHGGPTGATDNVLKLPIQFWTSRGIAVLDVNYGGSTGYGRAYRMRLNDNWGIVDIDDCCNGARFLVAQGLADGKRLIIRGGSAGGYTTLGALTFRDVFSVGASYYGLSDLGGFVEDTHKFESRYLDNLVGPYPAAKALYEERSPVYHAQQITCPVIFFQGLEDKVVLPNQAERMVDAMRYNEVAVAYVPFAGEQHGFRQAANIKRALEGELYFYGRVLGFQPADEIAPVQIENM